MATNDRSSPPSEPGPEPYRERAQRIVAEVLSASERLGRSDARDVVDVAYATVLEEAGWELRQVMTNLQTRLELVRHRADGGSATLSQEELDGLLGSIERAAEILDVSLDRNETAKQLIPLDLEAFDLSERLRHWLRREDLFPDDPRVDLESEPTPVRGDPVKLPKAVGSVIQHFHRHGDDRTTVVVRLGWEDDRVEGFVGLDPAPFTAREIMEDIGSPVSVGELRFDLPLVRALIERHHGLLRVQRRTSTLVGLAFELPALDTEWV